MQRLRCLFGYHRRSRHHAVHDGDVLRSRCAGCGVEMIKAYHGWTTQRQEAARARRLRTRNATPDA